MFGIFNSNYKRIGFLVDLVPKIQYIQIKGNSD